MLKRGQARRWLDTPSKSLSHEFESMHFVITRLSNGMIWYKYLDGTKSFCNEYDIETHSERVKQENY